MSEKGQKIYRNIMLVLITAIITILLTSIFIYKYMEKNEFSIEYNDKTSELDSTLAVYRKILEKEYLGDIDDEKLKEGAIKGYFSGLNDPYTEYYTKEEMDELMQTTNGNYVGIGIYMVLDAEKNQIVIIKPMEGSPAEEAGILPGDVIVKVDGQEYSGDNMTEASNKIKGISGSKVKLTIKRNNDKIIDFEIKRRKILISHIKEEVLDNNIGYIYISDFDGGCAEEFEKKFKELEKKGIKSLIIDIRNNGGGVVDEALDILDLIVEKNDKLLITKDKNEKEVITNAKKEPIIKMPIVVLTNEYSASASEILAGALKDNKKATIIGVTTYGKGVIQTIHRLKSGSGLKITTNEYYTPNHNKINKVGIEPDIKIEAKEKYKNVLSIPKEDDVQLQRAIEELIK